MITPRHQSKAEPSTGAEALHRLEEIERRLGELRSNPALLGSAGPLLEEVSTTLSAGLSAGDTEAERLRRQRDGLVRELSEAERTIGTLRASLASARDESDAAMREIGNLRQEVASRLRRGPAPAAALPIEQHMRREIGKAQSELETTAANLEDYRHELDRRFAELSDWMASLDLRERELERWAHVLEASLSPLAPGPTQVPVLVAPGSFGFGHPAGGVWHGGGTG